MGYRVEVIHISADGHSGQVEAEADVQISVEGRPFATLHGVRVMRGRKEPWVSLPQRKVGERWQTLTELHSEALKVAIVDAVLRAYSRMTLTHGLALVPERDKTGDFKSFPTR